MGFKGLKKGEKGMKRTLRGRDKETDTERETEPERERERELTQLR